MTSSTRIMACLALALLLAACASTGGSGTGERRAGLNQASPVRAAEINTRLGIGYLERGQLQVAMEKLETALRHDPQHVPAHLSLAMIHERLGDDASAERHYRAADRLAPEDGGTQNAYGVFLCRQQDYREADAHFLTATRDPFYGTPEVAWANAGVCARRAGRLEDATEYLRQALDIDSRNPDALYQLADIYLSQGEAFRARAFLQRLESLGSRDPATLLLGFQIESSLGNRDLARQYADSLERDYPDSREADQMRRLNRHDS